MEHLNADLLAGGWRKKKNRSQEHEKDEERIPAGDGQERGMDKETKDFLRWDSWLEEWMQGPGGDQVGVTEDNEGRWQQTEQVTAQKATNEANREHSRTQRTESKHSETHRPSALDLVPVLPSERFLHLLHFPSNRKSCAALIRQAAHHDTDSQLLRF